MRPAYYYLLPLLLLASGSASAQIYKCQDTDQSISYSDRPCSDGHEQLVTDIVTAPLTSDGELSTELLRLQLDTAVKSAIASGDLQRARALASTQEHRNWVADAQLIERANQLEAFSAQGTLANSAACLRARENLETATTSAASTDELLSARENLMHVACGTIKPVVTQSQPVLVYPYGRVYPGRTWQDNRQWSRHGRTSAFPGKSRAARKATSYYPNVQAGGALKSNTVTPGRLRGSRIE